jgi:hypothetical protein
MELRVALGARGTADSQPPSWGKYHNSTRAISEAPAIGSVSAFSEPRLPGDNNPLAMTIIETRLVRSNWIHVMLRSAVALYDIQDRILAQPESVTNFPTQLAFADKR